ncbi:MAG: cysteine peptidase family C39 domain-containing protein [Planctomycetota bacterium]
MPPAFREPRDDAPGRVARRGLRRGGLLVAAGLTFGGVATAQAEVAEASMPTAARVDDSLRRGPRPGFWRTARNAGANALYLLLRGHGLDCRYDELVGAVTVDARGASLSALERGAAACGFDVRVRSSDPRRLASLRLPVLAHLEPSSGDVDAGGRLVVVIEYAPDADEVVLCDAATASVLRARRTDFVAQWSGLVVAVADEPAPGPVPGWLGVVGLVLCGGVALHWLWSAGRRRFAIAAAACVLASGLTGQAPVEAALRARVVETLRDQREAWRDVDATIRLPIPDLTGIGAFLEQRLWLAEGDRLLFETTHGDARTAPADWQERLRIHVTPEWTVSDWPNKRLYIASAPILDDAGRRVLREDVEQSAFVRCTGWWPAGSGLAAGQLAGCSYDLLAIAENPGYVVAAAAGERVELRRAGRDQVVLRADLGLALERREILDEDGAPIWTLRVEAHREVARGVWLPERVRMTFHRLPGPVEGVAVGGELPVLESVGELRAVRLAARSTAAPAFVPVPGSAILDMETGRIAQVVAGGFDFLERKAEWIRRVCAGPDAARERRAAPGLAAPLGIGLAAGSAVLAAWWIVARRRAGTRPTVATVDTETES